MRLCNVQTLLSALLNTGSRKIKLSAYRIGRAYLPVENFKVPLNTFTDLGGVTLCNGRSGGHTRHYLHAKVFQAIM